MTNRKNRKLALMAACAWGPVAFAIPGSAWAQRSGEQAEGGIAEIIVTAQKREQNLQDVPVSVTALTADALAANRINNVRDLDAIAPNLTIRTVPTASATPTYSIRGLVSTGTAPGSDKGVAIYIDGVFLGAASGSIFDVADIERIEVLRGPQGTLFGRNSTGGAISIMTRNPTGDFGVEQDLTYGNYNQFRSRTRIETPQFGPLSAIVTYMHSERRGEIRNLGAGTSIDFSAATGGRNGVLKSPKWLGSTNTEAVTAAVKLNAASNLDFVYKFDYSAGDFSGVGIGVAAINPAGAGAASGLVSAYFNTPNTTPITTKRPDAVNNSYATNAKTRAYGHNLVTKWDIASTLTIKNILALRKTHYEAPGGQLDGMGGFTLGGVPFYFSVPHSAGIDKQWSDELQINWNTAFVSLTAGLVHYEQEVTKGALGSAPNILTFTPLPGNIVPDAQTVQTNVKIKADAAFAQAEVHATDTLDLILGARITHDRKRGTDRSVQTAPVAIKYDDTRPSFLAGITYKPRRNVLAYAKFVTGYISGGELATLTYKPETAQSWEAGIKADWLNRTLRTNMSLYHVDYKDQQLAAAGRVFGVPQSSQVLVNAGDARAYGFEFEGTALPIPSVTLQANIGYTNFKFTRLDPRVIATGSTLPAYRPKWTGSFSAQYETPQFGDGLCILLRSDATYRSKTYASPGAPTPQVLDAITIRDSWLVNARATLSGMHIGSVKAELALWARNLLDNKKISNVTNLGYVFPTDYERARTFGLDLSLKF